MLKRWLFQDAKSILSYTGCPRGRIERKTFYSPTSFDSVPYTNTSYPNKYDLKNEITLCTENAMHDIDLIHSTKDRIKKCIELF